MKSAVKKQRMLVLTQKKSYVGFALMEGTGILGIITMNLIP